MSKARSNGQARQGEAGGASPLSKSLYSLSLAQHSNASKPTRTDAASDMCPVCKSSRYLNPDMKFLINPECYHKMCESCVDRIFSHGPAPCPIAGCARTLRKGKFRQATFEDLKVEREVDIRRRVASIMNKEESDFETLKDYNDYLETVEEITWNLILKIDVDETNQRLQRWADAQAAELGVSNSRHRSAFESDPSQPSATGVVLKKGGGQRQRALDTANTSSGNTSDAGAGPKDKGFAFRGLKKRVIPPPEAPFDPFDGWSIVPQYYTLQSEYDAGWLTEKQNDIAHRVGGYQFSNFYNRALEEALGGLTVFVGEEIAKRDEPSLDAGVATLRAVGAAMAGGGDVRMDDVF
ncbi:TFIIH/NER complex subunit [Curvularia kusanoi]|uniref:RNA polymerase II transcription factor B subunit 3 n=1 Tax=Curvularia kusanoi TaxID=90978 RepID=A0A9P4TA60_CURKU|nr:TFIIH/NER complex subunit [Curvularia kusanoi]